MANVINVGVIGAGMFGGTVAKVAAELGIPAIVMNASKGDIDSLGLDSYENVSTFVVGDGRGTGKSRDIAKQFLIDHVTVFEEPQINDLVMKSDLIIVAGSAGGGYGSGTVPTSVMILNEMYQGEKLFIPLTALPDTDEQYTAQLHAEHFLKEILELEVPYIIYDNNKYKGLSAAEMHRKTMETISRDLKVLRGDYIVDGVIDGANMDHRDLLTVESTPGRILIGVVENIKDGNVVEMIENTIKESAHAEVEADKVVMASGAMYNLSEDVYAVNNVKHNLAETFGYHVTDYRNEAVYTGLGSQFAAVLLAGCSSPNKRIDQIVDLRVRQENFITTRKASTSNKLMTASEGNSIKLGVKTFGASSKSEAPQRQSVADIMKKLNK